MTGALLLGASGGAGGHGGNLPAWLVIPIIVLGFVFVIGMLLTRRHRS